MNNQKSGLDTENIGCLTDNGQLGLQAIKGQVWAICFHARSVSWTKLVVQLIVKSLMTQEPISILGISFQSYGYNSFGIGDHKNSLGLYQMD
jgi:hypothetical protein